MSRVHHPAPKRLTPTYFVIETAPKFDTTGAWTHDPKGGARQTILFSTLSEYEAEEGRRSFARIAKCTNQRYPHVRTQVKVELRNV